MKIFPIDRQRYVHYALIKSGLRRRFPIGWYDQFSPIAPKRTDADCCVIVSSPGRSGTMMVHSIFRYAEQWEDYGIFINPESWETTAYRGKGEPPDDRIVGNRICLPRYSVRKLRNGQMASGHLPWSAELAETIARSTPSRRFKHVFIYRDPRDFFVSQMNQDTYVERYPRSQSLAFESTTQFLRESFANDDERLVYYLQNKDNHFHMDYEPWMRDPNCFSIKFEDLYPDVLDSRNNVLGDSLRQLLEYLEVDVAGLDPIDFHQKVWNKSITASPEVNKIGQYKRYFKDHHYAILDTPEFRQVLEAYGYEW